MRNKEVTITRVRLAPAPVVTESMNELNRAAESSQDNVI